MYWCLLSILATVVIGVVLCYSVRKLTSNQTMVAHVDEFVGNMGSSVFVMELGVIARLHGNYSTILLLAGFVHVFFKLLYFSRVGGYMNPLFFLDSYYRNGSRMRFSLFFVVSIVVTQYVAMVSGQHLARFLWTFCDHAHVEAAQIACTGSISVLHSWYHVAVCEGFGVFTAVCIDAVTPGSLKEASGAVVMMSLYFFLGHTSGSFYNPIIATAFSFRCAGHASDWQYLVVYWIAPALGMVLALKVMAGVTSLVEKKSPEKTA